MATSIISYLAGHHLPRAHGFLESDIAADGLHTGLYWALGRDLYYVGTYHGATSAISLAIAMTGYPDWAPWPGRVSPRDGQVCPEPPGPPRRHR